MEKIEFVDSFARPFWAVFTKKMLLKRVYVLVEGRVSLVETYDVDADKMTILNEHIRRFKITKKQEVEKKRLESRQVAKRTVTVSINQEFYDALVTREMGISRGINSALEKFLFV